MLSDHSHQDPTGPRILFFGMPSHYSGVHLERLIAVGEHIVALGMSVEKIGSAPVRPANSYLYELAKAYHIPILNIHSTRDAALERRLRATRPDLAMVAAFPFRIPTAWLSIPAGGFLNVHPSLLPAHRGPAPLFWTLRAGETETGVTLHYMDEEFDTGDIIYQAPVTLTLGDYGLSHTLRLAEAGSELACRAARRYREEGTLPRRPQPPGGSYESFPAADDFQISADWPAERAFHFMRGTTGRMWPYELLLGGMIQLEVREALSYDSEGILGAPYVREEGAILVQFSPGVLRVRP